MFLDSLLEDRNGGYCLAKESWEALLDLTFQEDLCCTGPSFPLLLQVQTHLACCLSLVSWAVFTWSAAFCEFSQTLNCWWYQLDSFSVCGIVQNWQSYLAVMWARNECHLWFRTKDDSDSLSDWQWVRTRSAIHWVEQEVFLQRFWALPPFEGRLLAGCRLTLLSVFALVFLFSCSSMRSSIVPSRRTNLGTSASILFLQKAARLLPSTVKYYRSCLWLDERCIFTVVRFSDWFVVYSGRILRGLFFMCKSQYVWNKCIFA